MVFQRRKADHILSLKGPVKWPETFLFALPFSWFYRMLQPKK